MTTYFDTIIKFIDWIGTDEAREALIEGLQRKYGDGLTQEEAASMLDVRLQQLGIYASDELPVAGFRIVELADAAKASDAHENSPIPSEEALIRLSDVLIRRLLLNVEVRATGA